MSNLSADQRVVLTLDAGGTSFRFSAMQGAKQVTRTIVTPSDGHDLPRCLERILSGFEEARKLCPQPPLAISFAFPGPADYPNGIIGDLGNLPGFRGGVPLGPMLAAKFGIPVFLNNDGDLFALGESIAGFLPYVNCLLEKNGNPKRYQNLFGVTFGTGFGGGIVRKGELFLGDNSLSGEVWLLRNKLLPAMNAEESISIRAIRRVYAEQAGIPFIEAPDPREICSIGMGEKPGSRPAALEAFRQLGEVAGDAMAQSLTLVDGLAVIGGGIAGAWPLFLSAVVEELNGKFTAPDGTRFKRLTAQAYNLEDVDGSQQFLRSETCELTVPGTDLKVLYDATSKIGVGISRLGCSEAVAIGAYAFALQKLER